jgi:hypothetical protein
MDFRVVQEKLRQVMIEVQEEVGKESGNESHLILLGSIESNLMELKREIRGYELYKKKPRTSNN